MSRVSMGANVHGGLPFTLEHSSYYEPISQFQGAEREQAHTIARDEGLRETTLEQLA